MARKELTSLSDSTTRNVQLKYKVKTKEDTNYLESMTMTQCGPD